MNIIRGCSNNNRRFAIAFLVLCAFQCSFSQVGDREQQCWYDGYLSDALGSTLHYGSDFSKLDSDKHLVGHELLDPHGKPFSKVYKYSLLQADKDWIKVKAENRLGGRSYIYDSGWNVAYYIFESKKQEHAVGSMLIKHLISDAGQEMPNEEEVWRALLITLGYRGCFTDQSLRWPEYYKFDVCGSIGPFLVYDDLRTNIWSAVLGGTVFASDEGREKCLRSIISNYDNYPTDLQREVLEKTAKYLEKVNDDKAFYSKKIAEFVLQKGGMVPDRVYWDHELYWEWHDGKYFFHKDRWIKAGEKKSPAFAPKIKIESEKGSTFPSKLNPRSSSLNPAE